MSELVNNLQSIYNIKLQIKDVLGTDSDLFEDYPDLIEAAIGEGGGGSSADPFYNYYDTVAMIANEMSSADYVQSMISDNWSYEYSEDGGEVSYTVSWDEITTIDVDGDSVEKIVRVEIDGDPYDMVQMGTNINDILESDESFYNSIFPTLKNATLTASEDPSEDGYDYLLVGDLYAWNLNDNCAEAEEITENGFVPNNGALGFNVNVPTAEFDTSTTRPIFVRTSTEPYLTTGSLTIFNGDVINTFYQAVVYDEYMTDEDISFIDIELLNNTTGKNPEILYGTIVNGGGGGYASKRLVRLNFNTSSVVGSVDIKLPFEPNDGVNSAEGQVNINGADNLVDFDNDEVLHFVNPSNVLYFYLKDAYSSTNNKPIIYVYNGNNKLLVEDEDFTIESLE